MTIEDPVDVVVVGAGFAGLSAARRLVQAGLTVRVLEARDRVGGRTVNFTIDDQTITEGGGQYIGPTQDRLQALADDVGVSTYLAYDDGVSTVQWNGVRLPDPYHSTADNDLPDLIAGLQALADEVPVDAPWSAPHAAEWDRRTLADWLDENARTVAGRGLLSTICRIMVGSEPDEVSLLFLAHYIAEAGNEDTPGSFKRLISTHDGAQERRFVGGSHLVAQRVAEELGSAVSLSSPVRAIEHDAGGVVVRADSGPVSGRHVIVAVPPQLAAAIQYEPPLPELHQRLRSALPLGALTKSQGVYPTPFWRDAGLSGGTLLGGETIHATFDNTPPKPGPGVLFSFTGGRHARELAALAPDERRRRVLADLALVVGDAATEPLQYLEVQWREEEWTGGAPGACAPPGLLTECGHLIREPVGPIHWAGTETAVHWTGYMEGAVRSGQRAADEVLGAMRTAGGAERTVAGQT